MQCPTDGTTLTMTERSGIEIDYCPSCRGVWLDRGELDKIIERSLTQLPPQAAPAPTSHQQSHQQPGQQQGQQQGHPQQGYQPQGYQQGQPYKRKRKESWLSELFD
jgi:Zn-finger nucleic acid-binding protein